MLFFYLKNIILYIYIYKYIKNIQKLKQNNHERKAEKINLEDKSKSQKYFYQLSVEYGICLRQIHFQSLVLKNLY